MDVNAVAEYLKQNPQFFEDYADMIAEIFVPHPHGGHAIPIAERQIVTLREKNHELEAKLRELIRFGSENEATGETVSHADQVGPGDLVTATVQDGQIRTRVLE